MGVLSVSPANHSKLRRARKGIWPVALIEGPREPKSVFSMLEHVFREFEELFREGYDVFDVLTSDTIKVRCGIVATVNDLPASSKLGEFDSHELLSQSVADCSVCSWSCRPQRIPILSQVLFFRFRLRMFKEA